MPTFGNTNIEALREDDWKDWHAGSKFTLSEIGVIQSISLYIEGGLDDIRLAIYSDNAGTPDALQCETAAEATTSGWNTLDTITNPTLQPGTYWLAFQIKDDAEFNRYKVGATDQAALGFYIYNVFPDPFDFDYHVDKQYSIYATYTGLVGGYAAVF